MFKIENDNFLVEINPLGAEITRISRKNDDREYILNDTTGKYWSRHSPILFPSIGRSNDDHYIVNGEKFPMKQHGFARDYDFEVTDSNDSEITLTQVASHETKEMFPFDYKLQVTYKLTDNGLNTKYTVINDSDAEMPFALGSHPGFNLLAPINEYHLELVGAKTPLKRFGIGPVPFRDGSIVDLENATDNKVSLSYDLLDDGLIIIDKANAKSVILSSNDGKHSIELTLNDFPYVTIWSPEHKNAPFVCVEPFAGLPDQAGDVTDWKEKAGNNHLAGHSEKSFSYDMILK